MRKIISVPVSSKWCRQCRLNGEPCSRKKEGWCNMFDPNHPLARKHFRERSGLE